MGKDIAQGTPKYQLCMGPRIVKYNFIEVHNHNGGGGARSKSKVSYFIFRNI